MVIDFPIKDIKVGSRIRKEYGDVETMAASLKRYGQLQPIIIDDSGTLVAGGRRLEAAKQLGWDTIKASQWGTLDEVQKRELELEENIRRKELTWVEEVRALLELYNLRQERYGRPGDRFTQGEGYGVAAASDELDRSIGSISMDLQLARALDEFPALAGEKTKSAALKRYVRERKTQLRTEQARRTHLDAPSESQSPNGDGERGDDQPAQRAPALRQKILKTAWKGQGILYYADSRDIMSMLPPATVDCIVTDPPFGLGMFREGQTTAGTRLAEQAGHMYDDDPYEIMNMLDEVFMHAARVLKPDGHVYCFFHMTRYEEVFQMLRKHFGTCEETPLIWAKNTPGVGDPNQMWVYSYEPILWVNRGRHLVKPQAFNVLKYDTIPHRSKIHPTEKPAVLLRHLISASCVEKELVMDPFAGSGSTLVAAIRCGCRFYGVEREEKFHRSAVERISEVLASPEADEQQNAYQSAADLKEEA